MKFTVTFVTLLSITSSWAVLAKRVEEPKDKREAGYASSSGHSSSGFPSSGQLSSGHSSSSYQAPSAYQSLASYQPQQSLSHGDASAISVGAGYSIGGAKPSFSFGGHGAGLQLQSEGLQSGGHGTIQLAPITLQPNHGLVGTDFSQIMSQLQHSLNSGALTLQPSTNVAEFHEGSQAGQELSHGQLNYGSSPNLQQYVLAGSVGSAPSYSAGTKGLSSYATGPVLFNPSPEAHAAQAAQAAQLTYAPSAGLSLGDASSHGGHSFAGLSLGTPEHSAGLSYGSSGLTLGGQGHSLGASGLSLGGAGGHSFGGYSLGSSGGQSLGGAGLASEGAGHSLGGPGYSLGGSGISHGSSGYSSAKGSGPGNSLGAYYKVSSGGHGSHGKSAFKPSAFLGASIQSDSGLSGLSGSHGTPSFGGFSGGSHGHSFGGFSSLSGPSKAISPLYTKSEGYGHGSLDSAAAYSTAGHSATPPGTTYGFPTASYPAGAIQSASSAGPQFYVSSSKHPSFGDSFSYRSPGSSHSALSSHSSGPKYSFGGHGPSARYASPKDSHGAYSETSYNTIKYSEELKPRA